MQTATLVHAVPFPRFDMGRHIYSLTEPSVLNSDSTISLDHSLHTQDDL